MREDPEYREQERERKREQMRERYWKDPEYREWKLDRMRERYWEDPEYRERKLERERKREREDPEYRKRKREQNRDRMRERYWEDPEYREQILERERIRERENPEYRERKRERQRKQTQSRRAAKANLAYPLTIIQWEYALNYFNGCCSICERQLNDMFGFYKAHQGHWIPHSEGGDYLATNMVPLCRTCNLSMNNSLAEGWIVRTFGKRKANRILQRIEEYFKHVREMNESIPT